MDSSTIKPDSSFRSERMKHVIDEVLTSVIEFLYKRLPKIRELLFRWNKNRGDANPIALYGRNLLIVMKLIYKPK
ncbi:hypothetical protein [Natranaerobius trueperi]|uniref:hypothetical protein n=1 Tax=Natranaerobius trueperi TaxID=759412 RepID=UPI00117DCE70|nr:hypothetical protein [Natranaerobius trueperi]